MTGAVLDQVPRWLRWAVLFPVSVVAGFLAASVLGSLYSAGAGGSSGVLVYTSAFLSGLVYAWAALCAAHVIAPAHKGIVVAVLGFFILGDLSLVHLIQTDSLPQLTASQARESEIGVIWRLLRADDYAGLANGTLVKIAGALVGLGLTWLTRGAGRLREPRGR